ncbi:MAG: TolC family protein [Sulfurimonas sp.]|nr:TolC family protein [Sulfurimonas sp.]
MLKNILMSLFLCAPIYAVNFDIFLQNAIKNSPYLKSSSLDIDEAKEEASLLLRYENPTLELEYADFKPESGSRDNGYRINYTQPVRLWGIADDKKTLSEATTKRAHIGYAKKKALFIRGLSLLYTQYSQQKMLLSLGDEELSIAKKIYDISKARYDSGTISRGVMLKAQIAYEMIEVANETLLLASIKSYYDLLKFAGINEELNLDVDYTFSSAQNYEEFKNPDINILISEQDIALSEAKVNSNKLEWMNLFTEYESEPEQDIIRVGLSFPLVIFNQKSQERRIANLQASRSELLVKNEKTRVEIENTKLQKEYFSLKKLSVQNENILKKELELLKMFEEGYKISNINLLELEDIKNRVISTKESLIKIKTALNQNAINRNYLQGNYNE